MVFGHDHEAARNILDRLATDCHIEIDDRHGFAAHGGNTSHHRVGVGNLGQGRALHYLLNLEYIDAETLSAPQHKRQQFQAIMTGQLRPLVHRIHHTGHMA